jgi:lipoate-protein ligase A
MKCLDLSFPSPAENLACDEALLEAAEAAAGGEVLRFWESREYFVVVGYANRVASEVNVAACEAHGVPVLRRCSGGGAVVQGPGCLNYSLVLRITADGPTRNISAANRFIMERNRSALRAATGRSSLPIEVQGHTDLTIGGLKFSGNSQRRRREFLLFHGTFLLDFDLKRIGELLRMPSRQPGYREQRDHAQFVTNLNLPREAVKTALQAAWNAAGPFPGDLRGNIAALIEQKYRRAEWNWKW